MEIGALGNICGEVLDETTETLQKNRLSAIVAFPLKGESWARLRTFSHHTSNDKADQELEDAVFMHGIMAFIENGVAMTGYSVGINPHGPDVYAIVIGKAGDAMRNSVAKRLTETIIKRIVDSLD